MLQNAYFLAKIGADTAENEQYFAEICRDRDADAGRASGARLRLRLGRRRRGRGRPELRGPLRAGGLRGQPFFLRAMHVNSLKCSRKLREARSQLY